jgi:acyl-ACP thioesterase
VIVKTWPTPPTHVIFGREYQVLSHTGEVKVNATSRWCLIDMKEGKLLPSKVIDNQDYSTYNTTKLLDDVRWKALPFKKEDGELRFSLTVANSEYDHNMHVNNTRYADYCLNCFSVKELSEKKLKKFTISYVKQCKEGEKIAFYRQNLGGGNYLTQGYNEAEEMVVQAQICFEE